MCKYNTALLSLPQEKIMTDRTQFEAMLEALINEDQETAKEIFHNIVVAKSREIYEELLSEDFDLEEEAKDKEDKDNEDDEDRKDEAFGDDSEDDSAADDADDSEDDADDSEEEPSDDDVGGDATDDLIGDVTDDEDSEGSMSDEEQTDKILDLEDALEELKAEFEQMMAGEEGAPAMGGDDMGMDAEPAIGDEPAMGDEEDELAGLMEYVNKVNPPKHGDNGANTKSAVAGPNKMGGTAGNIAQSFSTTSGGTEGGLAKPSPTEDNAGNINVPGGKAGKSAFKKTEPGHGAEKKGKGESADNKSSLIGSRK